MYLFLAVFDCSLLVQSEVQVAIKGRAKIHPVMAEDKEQAKQLAETYFKKTYTDYRLNKTTILETIS